MTEPSLQVANILAETIREGAHDGSGVSRVESEWQAREVRYQCQSNTRQGNSRGVTAHPDTIHPGALPPRNVALQIIANHHGVSRIFMYLSQSRSLSTGSGSTTKTLLV